MVRFRRERGFTLIELMAVLAVLTIIAIIAVPAIGAILKNAEADSDQATVSMIERAAETAYAADGPESFDRLHSGYTVEGLVEKGFLDYDINQDNAITGLVAHSGHGLFTYLTKDNLLSDSINPVKNHSGGTYEVQSMQTPFGRHDIPIYTTTGELHKSLIRYQYAIKTPGVYTFSVWAKTMTPGASSRLALDVRDSPAEYFNLTNEWKQYSTTIKMNVTPSNGFADAAVRTANVPTAIAFWKVEENDTATPWIMKETN